MNHGFILQSLSKTVHLSLGNSCFIILRLHFSGDGFAFDKYFFSWLFRYIHVIVGIMWIGLYGILILFKYHLCQIFLMNKNLLFQK